MGNDQSSGEVRIVRSRTNPNVSNYPRDSNRQSLKVRPPAVPLTYSSNQVLQPKNYTMNKLTISNDLLGRFLIIQSEIENYNANGVFQGLKKCEDEYEELLKLKKQCDVNYRVLREQSNKEKQDYDNITSSAVQAYFQSKQDHARAIEKEKQEYMESVKEVTRAEKELKEISNRFQSALQKYNSYQTANKKALDLFNEQMNILYSSYEGEEGSDLENRLEKEVRELEEQKEILKSALNKWSNSRFLLVYAHNQLQCSELRWIDLMKMDIRSSEKVIPATEVRNNLIAAYQNLVNTKSYLKNVQFPYCDEKDLAALLTLSKNSYEDMKTLERQKYCLTIIQQLRKRCAQLNQWFDHVIKSTLVVDYQKVVGDLGTLSKELKDERIRLLQDKIKNETGQEVNVNLFNVVPEKDMTENDTVLEKVNSDANKINEDMKTQGGETTEEGGEEPTNNHNSSDFVLPPPPSKDQILGDIEGIKQQFRDQTDLVNKQMEDSRREADERLQKMLAQHSKK